MRKYFEYLNKEEQEDNEEGATIINSLAKTLKEEVLVDLYGRILMNKKLFSLNFSSKFLNELALKMKEKRIGPEEVIM